MSAETLTFGPEWLRALAGENQATNQPAFKSSVPTKTTKFKLAQYRYGREEMLALFSKEGDIPEELLQAPSIVAEEGLLPLSLIPMTEDEQRASTNVNSTVSYGRGRGGGVSGRGRSVPIRGRGRGRGDGYVRAVSHDEEGYSSRWENSRHDGWETTGRKGSTSRDGFEEVRKPRRVNSEDWRNDSARGRGDGAEDSKEWKLGAPRRDGWRGDGWRSREYDSKDKKSKPPKDEFVAVPEWAEEGTGEVGQFDSHGTYRMRKISSSDADTNWRQQRVDKTSENDASPGKNEITEELPPELGPREEKITLGEEMHEEDNRSSISEEVPVAETPPLLDNNKEQNNKEIPPSPVQDPIVTEQESLSQLEQTSLTVVNSLSEPEPDPIPSTPPKMWLYKDPQGDIQGPFSSAEMLDWFSAGYFQIDLLIRRTSDPNFVMLGELIKQQGSIPFIEKQSPIPTNPSPVQTDPAIEKQLLYQKLLEEEKKKQVSIQQQQAALQAMLTNLQSNEHFQRLPAQQQQAVAINYIRQMQQEQAATAARPQANAIDVQVPTTSDSVNSMQILMEKLQRSSLIEAKKREEEEIKRRLIEQEKQRQEEMRLLMQHEQQMNELRRRDEEIRKQREMLLRKEDELRRIQMEAKQKQDELEAQRKEQERIKQEEYQRQIELEQKRKQEEAKLRELQQKQFEEAQRKRMEEEQRQREEEEARLQLQEEQRRLEQERIRENERIEKERKIREELEKQREEHQQRERIKQEEMMRIEKEKQEAAAALAQAQEAQKREAEIARQKEIKRQQEQMADMKLPSHALWGHKQTDETKPAMSLLEIQQLEQQQEVERRRREEQMRAIHRATQPPVQKSGWGSQPQNPQKNVKTLLQIQQEEAKNIEQNNQRKTMAQSTQPVEPTWSRQVTGGSKPAGQWANVASNNSAMFWDQVVEEKKPTIQQTRKNTNKQTKNAINNNNKKPQIPQQQQSSVSYSPKQNETNNAEKFQQWCVSYMSRLKLGSGIDVPTFIGFLREVESSYEVRDYVCSYLGESKEANEFAREFVEKRKYLLNNQNKTNKSNKVDTDGFEVVQSNTKRGKRKQKKQQKVDPSILGFSVNAASDRVNMGEIQSANDL